MIHPDRFSPSALRTPVAAKCRGFVQPPVLVGMAGCVALGCALLGGGITPSRFRVCGAAIDVALSVTIDAWIGEDTLTMPGLRPDDWIFFDDLIDYGSSDLRRSEALIGSRDDHASGDLQDAVH